MKLRWKLIILLKKHLYLWMIIIVFIEGYITSVSGMNLQLILLELFSLFATVTFCNDMLGNLLLDFH